MLARLRTEAASLDAVRLLVRGDRRASAAPHRPGASDGSATTPTRARAAPCRLRRRDQQDGRGEINAIDRRFGAVTITKAITIDVRRRRRLNATASLNAGDDSCLRGLDINGAQRRSAVRIRHERRAGAPGRTRSGSRTDDRAPARRPSTIVPDERGQRVRQPRGASRDNCTHGIIAAPGRRRRGRPDDPGQHDLELRHRAERRRPAAGVADADRRCSATRSASTARHRRDQRLRRQPPGRQHRRRTPTTTALGPQAGAGRAAGPRAPQACRGRGRAGVKLLLATSSQRRTASRLGGRRALRATASATSTLTISRAGKTAALRFAAGRLEPVRWNGRPAAARGRRRLQLTLSAVGADGQTRPACDAQAPLSGARGPAAPAPHPLRRPGELERRRLGLLGREHDLALDVRERADVGQRGGLDDVGRDALARRPPRPRARGSRWPRRARPGRR